MKKRKLKKNIIRVAAIALVAVIVLSCFAGIFSANASSAVLPETEAETVSDLTVPETVYEIVEETQGTAETTIQADIPSLIPDIKKDKYTATFSLYNISKCEEITIILEKDDEEYEIVFTEDENYFVVTELPVGEYKVKSVETDERFVDATIDIETVEIKENDMQSITISGTEEEDSALVQFLARNWFLLLGIAALSIAYRVVIKKKKIAG